MTSSQSDTLARGRRRLLPGGESVVASAGLALASILLAAMGIAAWWSVQTQRRTMETMRAAQVQSIGEMLSDVAAGKLAEGDLMGLQRLLVATAARHDLGACRIVLPDGRVLADTDLDRISVETLPESWAVGPIAVAAPPVSEGTLSLSHSLSIAQRGPVRLDITAPLSSRPASSYWKAQSGVGLAGAAGLLALLLVYRRMQRRMRAMSAIRGALRAYAGGAEGGDALSVADTFGSEAEAWNRFVGEHDRLQHQVMEQRLGEALSTRRAGSSDLDSACDVLRQGMILIDRNGSVTYANGAAAVCLRTTRQELLGAGAGDFIRSSEVLSVLDSILAGTVRCWTAVEIEQPADEGSGVLRFNLRPLRKEDGSAAMIVVDDVTQQRVAERSRNAFVAQVTHELRAPLTNIRLYAESAIEEGEQDPEARRRCLNVITQEGRRLERIVGDMLSVAEMEAGRYQMRQDDVRLEALLADLRDDYRELADEKQIRMTFNLPPKLPVMFGDHDKIALTLHNLVGNALKYTPTGGRVEVALEVEDDRVVVNVTDSGIGIREDEQERVFERFYRANDARVPDVTGSGLGLTLAREIARLHGGDVSVRSQIDKGSTFTLTLPTLRKAA